MRSLRDLIKPKTRIKHDVAFETVWLEHFETARDGKKVFGECRYDPENGLRQIVISSDQSDTEAFKTYVHEVLHAIEYTYDLKIPHKTINVLEIAILRFLKLNGFLK